MEKIGIIVNQNKSGAVELEERLTEWLQKRDLSVQSSSDSDIETIVQNASLIITLGGDGTILSVAAHMKEKSVPILGVNFGRLGFLTEAKDDEVFEELNNYFLGHSRIEERLMIACTASSEATKQSRRFVALNDIVINREGLSRLLSVHVCVSGEQLTSFAGDGLIVATPTGSTAYSLSAGGAIVHPGLQALIINPICAHASSLRPMVVGADEKISIRIDSHPEGEKALLTADGQGHLEIDDSFNIEITRSNTPLRLIKGARRGYFARLRENFKFPV